MKVIDLLNKIANGEEVPKVIKYNDTRYLFRSYDYKEIDINGDYIDENSSFIEQIDFYKLNNEIEIIEEEQDIEELKLKDGKIVGTWENGSNYCYTLSAPQTVLCNKINELIKEVNKQKNNEEVL